MEMEIRGLSEESIWRGGVSNNQKTKGAQMKTTQMQ